MDWRSGSKQNATGSAFRGISSRGRGRGRGRGAPASTRGGSTPAAPASAPPTPAAEAASPSLSLHTRPKPPSRRGSHQPPRRAPSLSHLEVPKAPATTSDQSTTPGGRPQVARRASHNPMSVSQNPPGPTIPSVKLDPSTPTTPNSPRPKPGRKRSHNRTRSSSKASTQGQLSAAPSISSLHDKDKDTPPHLALASAPPDVQSFGLRTNIDTLVERVRAMAMAGSAADRDRDKEGLYTPSEGHIDWAGDEDDSLPDLNDWVRPKSAGPKEAEKVESDRDSNRPVLSPVEEVGSPRIQPQEKAQETQKEKAKKSVEVKGNETNQRTEDAKEVKYLKASNELNSGKEKEPTSGRAKTRGKHGGKKSSVSDVIPSDVHVPSPAAKPSSPEAIASATLNVRPPLVHPLPPKPKVAPVPARAFKPKGPPHPPMEPPPRMANTASGDVKSTLPPSGELSDQPPSSEPVPMAKELLGLGLSPSTAPSPGSQAKKRLFGPSVDWSKTPSPTEPVPKSQGTAGESVAASSEAQGKKRAFDPSIDWANAPYPSKAPSPRRSPTRRNPSPKHPGRHFSPPAIMYPHTAPPHGLPRGPFPTTSRAFPDPEDPPAAHTRSQVNSPESSPRRLQNREGLTHLRAHSSPQTGPGTRTHASRPIITLDAISRISRTLGVPGNVTPPRGQTVEVTVTD